MLPPHHVWDSTIIAFRSFKADLRPHRKAPNVMAITDCLPCSGNLHTTKKGDYDDTRNSGCLRWHGTDNGLCIWSPPL
jgi:hypothetical protein